MNYYIASLKHTHTHHEHVTFWGPNRSGYTPVFGPYMGQYDLFDAVDLNDGMDYIAVPIEAVEALQAPEPYYKPGARFYDQRGPVVENTRANWNAMIAASIQSGREHKPKPEVFRGKRRATLTQATADV